MEKLKNSSLLTLSVMLSIAPLEAHHTTPWWKKTHSKNSSKDAPKNEKSSSSETPVVSKPTETPWWKRSQLQKVEKKETQIAKTPALKSQKEITKAPKKVIKKEEKSQIVAQQQTKAPHPSAPKEEKTKKLSFFQKLFNRSNSSDKNTAKQEVEKRPITKQEQHEPLPPKTEQTKIVQAPEPKDSTNKPKTSFFKKLFSRSNSTDQSKTNQQEAHTELNKEVIPKTPEIQTEPVAQETQKELSSKPKLSFFQKLFRGTKTKEAQSSASKAQLTASAKVDKDQQEETLKKETEIAKTESKASKKKVLSTFFKNLFYGPKKSESQTKPITKTDINEPKLEKEAQKKIVTEPPQKKDTQKKEVKTTVTKIVSPDDQNLQNKEDKRGFSKFWGSLFKKSNSATKISSPRRIRHLGDEEKGYAVPATNEKIRRKGRNRYQFNT